ncbi:GMC family oxidoreductase [Insolitispirillum peregrinum]|uniref:Choline dehydrogenase n=1 Tax=Insolitispirillum peregrinum TaxID=80876 RepID=A0A1N7NMI3_9PROT|nr:GMC family oxidoreductase [Insolitispirillum peregrinum]SIS99480.1 Choline dehydrogenase [Insolitispirillum peregrinum]
MTYRPAPLPSQPEETITADVIVIGAGVAGGMSAWKLAQAGHSVAILDAGPKIRRDEAVARFHRTPWKDANSPYVSPPWAPAPDGACDYYVQNGCPLPGASSDLDLFQGIYVRGVGGTSWHMTGHAERFQPNDFRTRSAYGVGDDWPISYQTLEPWYYQAEIDWGVAGSMTDTIAPPREKPYPMPPVPLTWLDRQVAAAAATLSPPVEVKGYPHARNSVAYDNRPQCCGNANCRIICPIGAKYDGSVHVMKAEQAGARLYPERVAWLIETTPPSAGQPERITAVWFKHPDGRVGVARGKLFIIACHAIETPRLLLLSASDRHPNGIANSSGTAGRYLTGAVDVDTYGWSPNPVYPYRGPVTATGGFLGLRDGEFRKKFASVATFIVNGGINMALGPMIEAQTAINDGLLGEALAKEVASRSSREVYLSSTVEVMPSADNRLTLDEHLTDPLGLPRPHLHYHVDDYTREGIKEARERDLSVLRAMRATNITQSPPMGSAAIIAGTTRMGDDAKTSVVDSFGRSHDHPNLFLLGNSTFVTTTVCSPTLTNAAITLRAADHILATWRDSIAS